MSTRGRGIGRRWVLRLRRRLRRRLRLGVEIVLLGWVLDPGVWVWDWAALFYLRERFGRADLSRNWLGPELFAGL